jgi:hypothetical protein
MFGEWPVPIGVGQRITFSGAQSPPPDRIHSHAMVAGGLLEMS